MLYRPTSINTLSFQAIVVWGCDHFLKVFAKKTFVRTEAVFHRFLFDSALEAFNSSRLFEDSGPEKCRLGNRLVDFFRGFAELEDPKFWSNLLRAVFDVSWGPVPLFYITRAVFLAGSRGHLDQDTAKSLKDFVTYQLKCQEPLIRGAAQSHLLETVLSWQTDAKDWDKPEVGLEMAIADFLISFQDAQRILIRGTPLWSKCCLWVKSLLGSCDVEAMMAKLMANQSLSGHKIGFFFTLLFDAFNGNCLDIFRLDAIISFYTSNLCDTA